jgi:hypothetical protein
MTASVLLEFAAAEDLTRLDEVRKARDEAQAEARGLTLKAGELDAQAAEAHRAADASQAERRRALVDAVLSGNSGVTPPPAPSVPGPGAEELSAAASEMRRRAEARHAEVVAQHGRLRSLTIDLLKTCAQRAGGEYLKVARRLGSVHAAIGVVQHVLDGLGNVRAGRTPEVIVGRDWSDLVVPNSTALTALRSVGVVRGSHQRLPVLGGEERIRGAVDAEHADVIADIRDRLGEWPLSKKASDV